MSRLLSKNQKKLKRSTLRKNKIKKMERQDSLGISRKKRKKSIPPKLFSILKIISIIFYPIVYFIYSPLLIACVIFTISLFYFSTLVENHHNHTFIKKNHIKVNKFDSVVAVILLIITMCGASSNLSSKKKMPFSDTKMEIRMSLENIGSCLTGKRGLFNSLGVNFGMKEPPEGMNMSRPSPPEGMTPPKNFDMSKLPMEMVFSSALSSICTVLVFTIPAVGLVTLFIYYKKRERFNIVMNDLVYDEFIELTEEQYSKLFSFGYEEVEV